MDFSAAQSVNNSFSTELVYEDSKFNEVGVRRFVEKVNLAGRYTDYAIVSIMGPQSRGKSTLLNHMFGTNFKVMNAQEGRSQATKSIWLSQSPTLGRRYLVVDVEGTDGQERGNDTRFEKRSALFALAISDVVILNMWCTSVGLVHATCQPLLRTIFQVMKKLFTQREINLIFVLRDKTKTPLDKLKVLLEKDIQKIWNDIANPQEHRDNAPDHRFNACDLKQLVEDACTIGAVNPDWTSGSDFVDKARTIWNKIMENQDLDLPSINELIAMACCDKISSVQYDSFLRNETWRQIEEDVRSSAVQDFGKQVNELIGNYLCNYDQETLSYHETVRNQKRIQLKETMLLAVMPAYHSMLEHIRRGALQSFHAAFENELNNSAGFSDIARECIRNFLTGLDNQLQDAFIQESNRNYATRLREQLWQHVNDHVEDVRRKKVDDLFRQQRIMLANELEGPIDSRLRVANEITWVEIRRELESKTQSATAQLLHALSTFELDEEMRHNLVQELENHGRTFVRVKASRAANPRFMVSHMKERFVELFSFDSNTTIRVWEEYAQIEAARKTAHSSVVKMLSALAAVRIVDRNDTIEETLLYAIRDAHLDILNSTNWEQVIQEDVLLQPLTCKALWNDFLTETTPIVDQAFQQVRLKKWKKYATIIFLSIVAGGSLAIGGVITTGTPPVIATVVARVASAARAVIAAISIGDVAAAARAMLGGATTVAAIAAWLIQQEPSRVTELIQQEASRVTELIQQEASSISRVPELRQREASRVTELIQQESSSASREMELIQQEASRETEHQM